MSVSTILPTALVVLMIGAFSPWSKDAAWGYFPSRGLSAIAFVLMLVLVCGRW